MPEFTTSNCDLACAILATKTFPILRAEHRDRVYFVFDVDHDYRLDEFVEDFTNGRVMVDAKEVLAWSWELRKLSWQLRREGTIDFSHQKGKQE